MCDWRTDIVFPRWELSSATISDNDLKLVESTLPKCIIESFTLSPMDSAIESKHKLHYQSKILGRTSSTSKKGAYRIEGARDINKLNRWCDTRTNSRMQFLSYSSLLWLRSRWSIWLLSILSHHLKQLYNQDKHGWNTSFMTCSIFAFNSFRSVR